LNNNNKKETGEQQKQEVEKPDENEIIKSFEPRLERMARAMSPHVDLIDDLIQAGRVGVWAATRDYNQTDASLKTYVNIRAKFYMLDYLRSCDVVSRGKRKEIREAENQEQALAQQLGRSPTIGEYRAHTGLSERPQGRVTISHDTTSHYDGSTSNRELPAHGIYSANDGVVNVDNSTPEQHLEAIQAGQIAQQVLDKHDNSKALKSVLSGAKQRDIADTTGTSASRISQQLSDVRTQIRQALYRAGYGHV